MGRIILFFILIFGSAVIQTSFFMAAGVFPASPDLLLAAVIGIAIYDGERSAAAAGVAAGFLAEALGGDGVMLLPVFYLLIGYIFGIVSRFFLKKNFLSWLVYMLIAANVRLGYSFSYLMITEPDLNLFLAFKNILIPEFIMTVLFSIPIYFFSRICARPFHKKIDMD